MHLPWSETRVGRALLFLAVVWSIAGAFLALQLGLPELLGLAVSRGWVGAELVMPTPVTTDTASCSQDGAGLTQWPSMSASDPDVMAELRYATWVLGQRLGFAAGMVDAGLPPERLDPLLDEIATAARRLGLAPPRLPEIRSVANALHEFAVYVEADPECVAAGLTARYGPRLGHLYKFGAVIGHAIPYRANGIGAAFAPQIAVYGAGAGIPRDLWLPMTSESLEDIPGADPRQEVSVIVARLDDFLRRDR